MNRLTGGGEKTLFLFPQNPFLEDRGLGLADDDTFGNRQGEVDGQAAPEPKIYILDGVA